MADACPLSYPTVGLPEYNLLMYITIPGLLALLIIAVNIILIYTFYKTGQYSTISNKLLIMLNAFDLTTGIFLVPYYTFLAYDIKVCGIKKTVELVCLTSMYSSFNISCCITVDRYLHIKKASRYQDIMTNSRMVIIVLAAFVAAAINVIVLTIFPSFLAVLLSCVLSKISIIVMAALNLSMQRSLKSHSVKMVSKLSSSAGTTVDHSVTATKSESSEARGGMSKNVPIQHQLQAVKTIRNLLISLAVLYFPVDIINVVFSHMYFVSQSYPSLGVRFALYVAALMFISNSWVNALIIASGNRRCRAYISSHFVPKCRRKGPNQVVVREANNSVGRSLQTTTLNVRELPQVS